MFAKESLKSAEPTESAKTFTVIESLKSFKEQYLPEFIWEFFGPEASLEFGKNPLEATVIVDDQRIPLIFNFGDAKKFKKNNTAGAEEIVTGESSDLPQLVFFGEKSFERFGGVFG